jgi:hypothetical protein
MLKGANVKAHTVMKAIDFISVSCRWEMGNSTASAVAKT